MSNEPQCHQTPSEVSERFRWTFVQVGFKCESHRTFKPVFPNRGYARVYRGYAELINYTHVLYVSVPWEVVSCTLGYDYYQFTRWKLDCSCNETIWLIIDEMHLLTCYILLLWSSLISLKFSNYCEVLLSIVLSYVSKIICFCVPYLGTADANWYCCYNPACLHLLLFE